MLVYGVCVGPSDKFETVALKGIERVRKADDRVIALSRQVSIAVAYNTILDTTCELPEVEGLVLLHDDVELLDENIHEKLRALFLDGTVGVAGVVGASGVQTLEWWNYDTRGFVREDRSGAVDFGGGTHDVDVVDGLLIALSPRAVRELRFDESYGGFHGYDGDICLTAKRAGMRVVVAEIDAVHHTAGGYGDREAFDRADAQFRAKWALRGRKRPTLRALVATARSVVRRTTLSRGS